MDFFGLSSSVIIGIVTMTEGMKKFDKENKLKKIYVYIPLILSAISAYLITEPFAWKDFILNGFLYVGASSYAYNFFKKTIENMKN